VWAWLAAIVLASAAIRIWLVRGMAAPFVFVDELIYAELAKSLADGDGYAVREMSTSGYSLLYPALIAPAYRVFSAVPDAYAAIKWIGAVTMSLAAVPTFLIARRVVRPPLALLAAALAVAVPSMAYTGTVTTESLFYPVALTTAWLLLRYLERPGWPRLLALLAVVCVAFATRAQSLAFLPAIAPPPLVLALLRGSARALRPFVPLFGGRGWRRWRSWPDRRPAAGRRATCSGPTASSARGSTTSARCFASGSGTSRSSPSTPGSSPSLRWWCS
jgi:hypothetical protein